jgi:hypothetical protein
MSVVSGVVGAVASSDAADSQTSAANAATAAQLSMYNTGRTDTAPWRAAGREALNTLVAKVNAGPGAYQASPGYEFRLNEGIKAVENSAAARGGVLSGAATKALQRYGQDYATNDYQNFLANYYNSLTPYQSLANVGQTTAAQNAVQGNQVGQIMGQNTIAAGNAQATGAINSANAVSGALNSGVNNYMMWKYLNGTGVSTGGSAASGIGASGGYGL